MPATLAIPLAGRAGSALPAADSSCGNVQDSPAPNTAKPATAPAGAGLSSAPARPAAASSPQPRTSAAGPNRAASRSPASRPSPMVTEKPAQPPQGKTQVVL